MEEPYNGYTHELASGGIVEHQLEALGGAGNPHATIRLWLQTPSDPQVETTMTLDEAVALAASLLRDVLLARRGHG